MDVGLLLLRLVVGAVFAGHGARKLFGSFGGPGLQATGARCDEYGYRPGVAFATAWGMVELGAGILMLLGLFVPLAAALAVAVLVTAIGTIHGPRGLWNSDGGYEYPAVLIAAFAALAFTGPGALSVTDGASGVGWGFTALLAGLAAGLAALAVRRPAEAPADEAPVSPPRAEQ